MINLRLAIVPKRKKKNGECIIYVMVPKDQKSAWISTKVSVLPTNFEEGRVIGGEGRDRSAANKNILLAKKLTEYEKKLIELDEKTDSMSLKEIREYLITGDAKVNTDFFVFTERRIKEMKTTQPGTVTPLTTTLNNVKSFHKKSTLDFNEITVRFLQLFEAHYLGKEYRPGKKYKKNAVAFYLRYIRSMFNDAIDELNVNPAKPVILNYPFRKFKIVGELTKNRNLPIETIRKIRDFQPETSRQEITKDIFMLQFYLFGINLKDLFYMKQRDIVDGRIQFDRFKTDRFYNIKLEPEAQTILDKYKGQKYLIRFADYCLEEREENRKKKSRKSPDQYADQRSFNRMINTNLKTIHDKLELNLSVPLTSYFVRHSFASIMRKIKISKDDISLCLGHVSPEQSMRTSGTYINEDWLPADEANRKLIDYLNSDQKKGSSPGESEDITKTAYLT